MPFITKSGYNRRPWYLPGKHLETVLPSLLFSTPDVRYRRDRLELSDGDFLDLDWLTNGNKKLLVFSHGLEGSSDRQYITRGARYFHDRGWDILAWNCRGCSGEVNRALRTYQHGDIEDIGAVIDRTLHESYDHIAMVGFSMGGNMTLKYLGTHGSRTDDRILGAVVYSVPCHIDDSSRAIGRSENRFYERRFLRKLRNKIALKIPDHPDLDKDWSQIRNFDDFNEAFTFPVFGFRDNEEFVAQARTDILIKDITKPTLIVQAQNDPMLEGRNYPVEEVKKSECVFLEMPKYGGHVGFTLLWNKLSYMESRTEEFLTPYLPLQT